MFLVIPAEDDLTVTLVLPTGVRDRDEAAAAALDPLARGVLTAAVGLDGTPLGAFLASRDAVAEALVGYETLTFRCCLPPGAVADCLPVFLEAVARPSLTVVNEQPYDARGSARSKLREMLFAGHPLARPIPSHSGTPELSKVHQDVLASGTPVVVVAAPETLVPGALEALKSALPQASEPACGVKREAPPTEVFSIGGLNLRAAAESARARVAAGGIAAARTEPAALALAVLTELFGDGEASVLWHTLNTDFGIRCVLEATYEGYQDCGLFQVELDLDTEWVATAESLIRELLELTAAGRLGEAAFLTARTAACERASAEASDVPLASYRAAIEALDGSVPGDRAQRLEQVTPEGLASAAARVLRTYSVAVV
ncbi:insulinase family protein [Streptomyces sp. R28]|uniref:Insulinase family protein n=1 Tax=Streptomyces sp. R28 TaxID=3238628 RepID=A0AB39Q960_9ACTN